MGLEKRCTLRIGRKRHEGKALLESAELLFRGDIRLAIPFTAVRTVRARDGRLEIEWTDGTVALELGADAEKWALRMQRPRSRLDRARSNW